MCVCVCGRRWCNDLLPDTCEHTHTHTHTYTHTLTHTHTHTNTHTHTHTYIYIHTHTHTHIHIYTHTHTHVHIQVPEETWTLLSLISENEKALLHTAIRVLARRRPSGLPPNFCESSSCVFACLELNMYACMEFTCVHACMYLCTCMQTVAA